MTASSTKGKSKEIPARGGGGRFPPFPGSQVRLHKGHRWRREEEVHLTPLKPVDTDGGDALERK